MTLDESRKNDETFQVEDVPFYFDPFSAQYLDQLTVDYHAEMQEFIVSSPNSLSGC